MCAEFARFDKLLILGVQLDKGRPKTHLGEFLCVPNHHFKSGESDQDLELPGLVEERHLGDPAELDRVRRGTLHQPLELVALDHCLRSLEERVLGP